MMHVRLPDRKNVTLCEAVTAFVYGAPRDGSAGPFQPNPASDALLKQLHEAALAGSVRFFGIRCGITEYHAIEPSYFSERRHLDWNTNQIHIFVPCDEGEYEEELCREWYDVHLDRGDLVALLDGMGVLVNQSPGGDGESDEVLRTGAPGRPTSRHLVEAEAQRRLDAGDYPETLTEFSRQLAEWLKAEHPEAPPMGPSAIANCIRRRWHERNNPPK
jgi:hypothetical protein